MTSLNRAARTTLSVGAAAIALLSGVSAQAQAMAHPETPEANNGFGRNAGRLLSGL
jgi:hypothetical protein